jgi:hypothetical protein
VVPWVSVHFDQVHLQLLVEYEVVPENLESELPVVDVKAVLDALERDSDQLADTADDTSLEIVS